MVVNRRNWLVLSRAPFGFATRIDHMHDLMLFIRLVLRVFQHTNRQGRAKLLLHCARRHLKLAVNRINHALRVLRDADLGDVPRGKAQALAVDVQIDRTRAKHHQIVIQLMHFLLEVRAVKRLIHLVDANL